MRMLPLFALLAACSDTNNPTEVNDNEVITTVVLEFTPVSGGTSTEFRWADPDNVQNPIIDDIVLSNGEDYDVTVTFLNELETPPENITEEVRAESDEHQVFFSGTALESIVSHTYEDTDGDGFPIGLDNRISTLSTGSGTFLVTLRHLPSQNGVAVKTGTLADDLASGGFDSLPGDSDVQVTFELDVQ